METIKGSRYFREDEGPSRLLVVFICFLIMCMNVPVLTQAISVTITTYAYMLLQMLVAIQIIGTGGTGSVNLYLNMLLPFLGYELLTIFINNNGLLLWGYGIFNVLVPVIIGYFLISNRVNDIRPICVYLILSLLITTLTTIIGLIRYPNASRILATIGESQNTIAVLFRWNNIGGYGFIYTITLLYPLLICAYKCRRISLITALIGTALIYILIIFSEYTTAFLMILFSTVLFFFPKEFRIRRIIWLLIMSIIAFFLFDNLIGVFLQWISSLLRSDTMSERISALSIGESGLEMIGDNRISLYRSSIQSFLANPIFGTFVLGKRSGGGHSQILDALATYGLVGGVLMVAFYRRIYYTFFKSFSNKSGYSFYLWIFIQAILLSLVNTDFWFSVLALYAPVIFQFLSKDEGTVDEGIVDRKYTHRAAR